MGVTAVWFVAAIFIYGVAGRPYSGSSGKKDILNLILSIFFTNWKSTRAIEPNNVCDIFIIAKILLLLNREKITNKNTKKKTKKKSTDFNKIPEI